MDWWIWIVAGAVLLVAEVVISTDFYLVFLGAAALVVGFLALAGLDLPLWAEGILYAVLAIAATVAYRRLWRERLQRPDRELAPELVGEMGTAQSPIAPGARGKVELRGSTWDACNESDTDIAKGTHCRVLRVDGLTLIVRPE